jgi:hypothetical protein
MSLPFATAGQRISMSIYERSIVSITAVESMENVEVVDLNNRSKGHYIDQTFQKIVKILILKHCRIFLREHSRAI